MNYALIYLQLWQQIVLQLLKLRILEFQLTAALTLLQHKRDLMAVKHYIRYQNLLEQEIGGLANKI